MLSGPLEQGLGQGCSQELLLTTILACKHTEVPFDSSSEKQAIRSAIGCRWYQKDPNTSYFHKDSCVGLSETLICPGKGQAQFVNPTR